MKELDPLLIGLRTQDFHESLKNTASFGPKEVHYENTLLIGKAASLAMHLRGLLYIDDYDQIKYAAASLGILALELPQVLKELEEVDFISIVRSGDTIRRIDIRVPQFRSGYNDLGERWKLLNPSEIEQASIQVLDKLHDGPENRILLLDQIGLDDTAQAIMIDIMESGSLASTQTVNVCYSNHICKKCNYHILWKYKAYLFVLRLFRELLLRSSRILMIINLSCLHLRRRKTHGRC